MTQLHRHRVGIGFVLWEHSMPRSRVRPRADGNFAFGVLEENSFLSPARRPPTFASRTAFGLRAEPICKDSGLETALSASEGGGDLFRQPAPLRHYGAQTPRPFAKLPPER